MFISSLRKQVHLELFSLVRQKRRSLRMYGPAVRRKRFLRSGGCGLAPMYPASDWSALCSGPRWISARVRPHEPTGLGRPSGERQCSHAPGRPSLHFVSTTRRPRRVRGCGYIADKLLNPELFLCLCRLPFLRPGLPVVDCAAHRGGQGGPQAIAAGGAQRP
jgi:hypothetical protein